MVSTAIPDPTPNVFYDAENGNVKKIILKKDSSGIKGTAKPLHASDSTNSPSKGTPTNGDQQGFDIGG